MKSHKILLEIVPYLQKTKHKLLYKKKNASTWIPRAERPTTSQGLSDAVFRVKSSGKLIVLRLHDTRFDASTWNSSTDRGQLIEECHIKQARAKLMCSKKEGDCLGKTHTHTTYTQRQQQKAQWRMTAEEEWKGEQEKDEQMTRDRHWTRKGKLERRH